MEQIKGTQRRISINGTELRRTHGILMWTHSYMEDGKFHPRAGSKWFLGSSYFGILLG